MDLTLYDDYMCALGHPLFYNTQRLGETNIVYILLKHDLHLSAIYTILQLPVVSNYLVEKRLEL